VLWIISVKNLEALVNDNKSYCRKTIVSNNGNCIPPQKIKINSLIKSEYCVVCPLIDGF
jgi:hypothetical protein